MLLTAKISRIVPAIFFLLTVAAVAQTQPQGTGVSPLPLDASPEQAQQAVAGARAGRKLTPKSWPNGARVAVCLSFDVDNEYPASYPTLPVPMSGGEYGATTGLPRILALLDRHQIPASFFIPAISAILHPQMIEEIKKANRHEIGVHGWIHERPPRLGSAAKEEELLNRTIDYLTKAIGKRPVGYRAPSWELSQYTLGLIKQAGFLYDSSMMAMDQPYEILSYGKPIGLIELPVTWILDDYPYFGETVDGSLPLPSAVFEVFKAEFDGAYQEGTIFMLTMHPHIIGHHSRMAQLDRLITYIKSKPGVWFATQEQVANYIKAQ